ncbi:MAG: hypothetical protein AUK47_06445 [Deltaproteobacteria bacterium CG2_30_63_29]|nr:MAG: hypothetical protein AUK47_06445 [Deltaproteobacteria bacterium CG2_30_63_29]PJB48411.1 MAG: hypothetical protein CO108_02425 [Deltaproteobacteria bacterium CG_4_9_14_3_um_filter_63_12]
MKARTLLSLLLLVASLALSACTNEDDPKSSTFAINPLTGELKEFASADQVPDGWATCPSESECPAPVACSEVPEAACMVRSDCEPNYASVGAYPVECDTTVPTPDFCDGTLFTGCLEKGTTCDVTDCGPGLEAPSIICPDGSVGGNTGRCLTADDGTCGWEMRQCPDPCTDTIPNCFLACPEGTHNPTDECGRVLTCECAANDCSDIPECELSCGPGTHNPVDALGCTHSCECAPDATDCTDQECGPAPMCAAYLCEDGSTAGCTGLCYRLDDGTCGWEIRECPAPTDPKCTDLECGPAPDCPTYLCEDGSTAGCTDLCYRLDDGTCGWEIRECPAPTDLKWWATCGDPVCQGHTASGLPACTTETIGDPCSPDGASCDPGNQCNSMILCASSDPQLQPGGCPKSRREFKEEIHYLGPEDRARFAEEINSVRLATYRYKDAPERTQLGFIIEDQEPSLAIDSDRDMINLYGYTSMVVAALQTQSAEMDAMRRELEELRAQVQAGQTCH